MSASKRILAPYHVISAQSMTGDVTGAATNIQYLDNVSIQLNFTGTPTGTFSIQGSLDHAESSPGVVTNAGNWIAITLPTSPAASGSAGNILIDMQELSFPWVRIVYTHASGTGTLDAYISGKSI